MWHGRFTLPKVVLKTMLFFPFKFCPWQLRAMKWLTKHLLLMNIHEQERINTLPYLESHIKAVYRLFLVLLVAISVRWL